ncbi:MAG: hypothetical protein RLZZ324_1237 [Candidatus Parcubacteria bacterium]|jgi:amidophosphoribosyltransferase
MCGIIGVFGVPDAARIVSQMLLTVQHRGQTAAGIVSAHQGRLYAVRGLGLVDEVKRGLDFATQLPGDTAIGHVRYATQGSAADLPSIQPMVRSLLGNEVALCHNGNITNFEELRRALYAQGATFSSESDSEIIFSLAARSHETDPVRRIAEISRTLEGAWTILALRAAPEPKLVASMDPFGFRPLVTAPYKGGMVFSSETAALDLLGISPSEWTHLEPGTSLEVTAEGINLFSFAHAELPVTHERETRHCSFEHVYYSRPDSVPFGLESQAVRKRIGRILAREHLIAGGSDFDVVTAVPDSSNSVALAFAKEFARHGKHAEFEFALIRNHYTGRTFITPDQFAREYGVRMKMNVVRSEVHGERVAVVDDSLVRGTTSKKVAQLLRDAGAKEVHFFLGSPPVKSPCHWGIDTPTRQELASARMPDLAVLARHIGADSVRFLSQAGLQAALEDTGGTKRCYSCFTGRHPTDGLLVRAEALVRR